MFRWRVAIVAAGGDHCSPIGRHLQECPQLLFFLLSSSPFSSLLLAKMRDGNYFRGHLIVEDVLIDDSSHPRLLPFSSTNVFRPVKRRKKKVDVGVVGERERKEEEEKTFINLTEEIALCLQFFSFQFLFFL